MIEIIPGDLIVVVEPAETAFSAGNDWQEIMFVLRVENGYATGQVYTRNDVVYEEDWRITHIFNTPPTRYNHFDGCKVKIIRDGETIWRSKRTKCLFSRWVTN
jgi:hypothetical protein